ncbi:putative chromatin regulator PHD family [Helianthus annuus]|uniref:Chromatin regulator PHD family n=1 Tax=Helianthus annuus TaxID=4232 RepID=A0A251T515_HELAN|nr:E3 ubiquitin-protein ligase WAV3 [Helianthus annuus]KAF5778780.1 putative chromatin regulator PHD family [Helianthus annuus]KAJ0490140.1 putative chromatin regulator PHD family [Helianthus annuus]KAJ0494252.1 putative chromatin regulator PHD family [Helianthus annuus]KAJ0506054.1 putative chromatin regulator PHD family [Helianthus annuus]KAJ0675724.1 putative chromatin regulator PHD family [Helianthus annuus]
MVLGWRRAFCTSISRETTMEDLEYDHHHHSIDNTSSSSTTPKLSTRFGFFTSSSNPSTPRLRSHSSSSPSLRCRTSRTTATVPAPPRSAPLSPKLQCETNYNSPRGFLRSSNPSSPRSPSPFSFLKSGLRLCTRRCGLCLQSVKKGQGTATFTAECSHTFHFPCISDHVKKQGSLACPLCSCLWKEMPMLAVNDQNHQKYKFVDEEMTREKLATRFVDDVIGRDESPKRNLLRSDLKVYNDDEPLASLTPKARFNPIPESDENCDEDCVGTFQGSCFNGGYSSPVNDHVKDVEVRLLPEAALIAVTRRHETYAIVLKVKAPEAPDNIRLRAPIDLVTVVDVSGKITNEKLQMIKKAMRSIVLSLSSSDRLSIVAFSSHSKRLLPLRRMTTSGRRSARRIVEAMAVIDGCSNSKDAVKKAVKVLEDRREKNPVATVLLLSDVTNQPSDSSVSSVRYPHSRIDIPIHSVKLNITEDHVFAKFIGNLLTVAVEDLRLQLGFFAGSSPAEITAVYSRIPQPIVLGSSTVRIGDLSADEEREILVELKLPSSTCRSQRVLSVQCCYNESSTQQIIYGKQHGLLVPRLNTVRSSSPTIQRLRNVFISTRALAESRRLRARNDLNGAYHMLVSARALMRQLSSASDDEFMLGLEAELSEVQRHRKVVHYTDEKGEPLTPTSAWRVADKLAKVAMMRKSVNRVSDLHGFEDARF